MSKRKFVKCLLFFVLILNVEVMNAQDNAGSLNSQQQELAGVSVLTATGDLPSLKIRLNAALDAGLTINEIKEELVQLYAYCGFPRSLNALGLFSAVLEERKAKGITDSIGEGAAVENNVTDKYEQGRKVLEALTKVHQPKPAPDFGEFAPRIDAFLKEHLFADIFASDALTYQQRELITIAALAAMTGTEGQLKAHIGMGINTGITENQIREVFGLVEKYTGGKQADIARAALSEIISKK